MVNAAPDTDLLDALPLAAVAVDGGGAVVGANDAAVALAGRDRDRLLNRPLDLADGAAADQRVLNRPDGTIVPVRLLAGPPRDGIRVVTLIDLTEQSARERAAEERYATLAQLSDRFLHSAEELDGYSHVLERRVRDRTAELHALNDQLAEANADAVYMLAVASEAKDADTGAHVRRLQRSAALLARALGHSEREAAEVGIAAVLHDIGKLHVPDAILTKPGPLTADERRVIEEHPAAGERILADKPFFARARRVARGHHENFDGSGYPDRLAGDAIPIEARIVHLADVYDALTHPRSYKPAWQAERARQEVVASSGRMFDPVVVRAFQTLVAAGSFDID